MSRFVPRQADLFAPPAAPKPAPVSERPPLDVLRETLAMLRTATATPWPRMSDALEKEMHLYRLGQSAGPEGKALVSAIFTQIMRLHHVEDEAEAARVTAV